MKRPLFAHPTIVLLTCVVLMLFANSAFAQAVITVAQLNGTVRDSSGSVVANASVSLRNVDTNRTYMPIEATRKNLSTADTLLQLTASIRVYAAASECPSKGRITPAAFFKTSIST